MENHDERRKFIRLNLSADITYTKVADSSNRESSITRNISLGGLCIISYERLGVGDILKLAISFPDSGKTISAQAKVSWIKEFIIGDPTSGKRYDVGAEFINIDQKDREDINKYIFSHL